MVDLAKIIELSQRSTEGVCVRGLLLGATFLFFTGSIHAEDGRDVESSDVLVAVTKVANEVESIRLHMGRPVVSADRFRVKFAAPRHDFYQAQTLLRKVNRLGKEVAEMTHQPPPPAPENHPIAPKDVLRLVVQAQNQLALIRSSLRVEVQAAVSKHNPQARPGDVFEELTQINRQLNLMIYDLFRSSDVLAQLSLANVYLGGVLEKMDKQAFLTVPFVANKEPIDVYEKLIDCFVLSEKIGGKIGAPVLQINARRLKRDHSIRSDNYDLATTLLADIAFWSAELDHSEDLYPPTKRLKNVFPAHVYAQAEAIRVQLTDILGSN